MDDAAHMHSAQQAADKGQIETLSGPVPRLAFAGPGQLRPSSLKLSTSVLLEPETGEIVSGSSQKHDPDAPPVPAGLSTLQIEVSWELGEHPEATSRVISGNIRNLKGLSNDA